MRALIMAGGAGSRLSLGEKPLALICGRPMIEYIIHAFQTAGCEPVVVVSQKTPMTQNWCHANSILFCRTDAKGFVEDMVQAVGLLEEADPLFVSVSDIPCLTAEIIRLIAESYKTCGKDALSTWVPALLVKTSRGSMPYREWIDGIEACPAGINVLRGDDISGIQDEYSLLLNEPRLSRNVNTRADRDAVEAFMRNQTKS